jgi:ABC-type antimicrobial peptide transport system permease subunit
LLLARYQEQRGAVQIVRSKRVITELLNTIFTVRDYIVVGIALVAVATGTVAVLVFYLSLRLRRGERFTLARIGASTLQIHVLMATEVLVVALISLVLASLLTLLTWKFGLALMQQLLVN